MRKELLNKIRKLVEELEDELKEDGADEKDNYDIDNLYAETLAGTRYAVVKRYDKGRYYYEVFHHNLGEILMRHIDTFPATKETEHSEIEYNFMKNRLKMYAEQFNEGYKIALS